MKSDSVKFCELNMLQIQLFSQYKNNMWSKIPFKCHNTTKLLQTLNVRKLLTSVFLSTLKEQNSFKKFLAHL